jgi:argininosuccinate lyase
MKNKLWHSTTSSVSNKIVENYTVGNDHVIDQKLVGYDIQASIAHAKMLHSIQLLTAKETEDIVESLKDLKQLWEQGNFQLQKDLEDSHTAIEAFLIDKLGDTGKKIHAARSRNDQALVMMRLYLKDSLLSVSKSLQSLVASLQKASENAGNIPMPGYTHMQKAMPTTVREWLMSYAYGFIDAKLFVDSTLQIIDQNPLGSAAGYGISLPINREVTTKLLNFSKTQENSL